MKINTLDVPSDEGKFGERCLQNGDAALPERADIDTAKSMLGAYRCVILGETSMFVSSKQGISPLIEAIESGKYFGCVAADKIVGKAAALLYAFLGAKEVYGEVMSVEGDKTLERFGIKHAYGQSTEYIRGRISEVCPMEEAVRDISCPRQAVEAIKATLIKLKNK